MLEILIYLIQTSKLSKMGCAVSQEEENRVFVPTSASRRLLSPSDVAFDDLQSKQSTIQDYATSSTFDGVLLYFDEMDESEEKAKVFYDILGNKMGELYMSTLSKIEEKLIRRQIGTDDLKVTFSKTILLQILNMINKLQQRKNWKNQRIRLFEKIADCQKKIIQFLQFKYPRNKKDFIPTDLQEVFYSVDDSQHTDYDLLINTGINFDYERIQSYERKQVIRQIKKLINQLILQTNRSFEYFREVMEKIFSNVEGTFKIGRKISENVSLYKDFDSDNMEIHSPEIFRVIIKFISYIQGVFLNSMEVLKDKKYFKILEKDGEDYSYYPLYTGKNSLISNLASTLEPSSKQYLKQQQAQQASLANFNDTLSKILTKKTHVPEINQSQIKTIKYAKNISKFVQFLAIEKLIYLITELVNLRQKMDKKNRRAVDLITCNINDLLRCQFMGSKKAVLDVFLELKKLEKQQKIKIIRVKNRFATPLNDVLVNFKFVGEQQSPLMCQIQLILKKSGFEGNPKFQAHAKVNHVLYELQRSIFGPMAEMSLLLTHNDTRMGYQKKIKLEKTPLRSMRCPKKQVLQRYDLPIPYVCSLCAEFHHINQNPFPIHRCQNCNFYVCPGCLFEFDPEFSEQCYLKEIFMIFKDKFMNDLDENQEQGFFFFNKKYYRVEQIFKKQSKNFFDCLRDKMQELDQRFVFILRFIEGNKYFNAYHLHNDGGLLPTFFDLLPRFQRKDFRNHKFSPHDIVLFLDPNCSVTTKKTKQVNLSLIPLTNIDVDMRLIGQIYFFKALNNFFMIDIGDQQRDNDSNSIQASNPDKTQQIEKILEGYRPREGQLLLDYLDMSQLNFGSFVMQNLRFAKLKSNRLKDLTPILKYNTLEEIDASRNQICQIKLKITYKKLRILDLSENFIDSIDGISNGIVPDLKQLNLCSNNLKNFPQLQLMKLLWLNLSNNQIEDISNIKTSELPKLRKLSLNKNFITQIPMNSQMKELLDIEVQNNKITDIQFLFCSPKIEQAYFEDNDIKKFPENLHLFYLQKLDLCKNQLTDLRSLASCEFPMIIQIDFSNNHIRQIPKIEFETLEILNFENNDIDNMHHLSKSQNLENLKRLNLKDNKIVQFCILVMEVLIDLDISHNKIKDMSSLVHSKLPILKNLDLSHNQIDTISAIDQLELEKLMLNNNCLQTMDFLKQSNIPALNYLNLNKNKIQKFISADFPSLEQLLIKNNQLTDLTEIKEQHLKALKVLNISENKIVELPSMFLQSVQKLYIQINNISVLDQFKKSVLPELTVLDIKHNKIKSFPTMTLPNLTSLLLDSNQIIDMKSLSLCQFPHLEELRLINNKLTQLSVLKLDKLSILNIQRNQIQNIDILESYQTPQIMQLKMARNAIKKLCYLQSNSLNLIDVSNNKVSEGMEKFFSSSLPKLLTIKLSSNLIQGQLPSAKDLPSLKFLDISKNSLTGLTRFLEHSYLPKLDILKLNNNKIKNLGEMKFPKLKQLDLSNNSINIMVDFMYSEIPKIKKVSLHNNQIHELPKMQFNTLTLLNLQNNKIQQLGEFQKSDLPSIEKLILNKNKIKNWPKELYLEKLLKLNLGENLLSSFQSINEETTPQLTQLILNKNNIEEIHQINLPNLIMLNLDSNPISSSENKIKEGLKANSQKTGKINKKLKLVLNKTSSGRDKNDGKDIMKLKQRVSAL